MRKPTSRSDQPPRPSWFARALPIGTFAIALVALVVSISQLAVTAPLLTQFYFRPDVVVSGSKSSGPKDKVLFAGFTVSNDGNTAATKVEIGFVVEENQRVTVSPRLNVKIVEDKGPFVKHVRLEVDRLLPRESFNVVIFPGPSLQTLPPDVAETFIKAGTNRFPAFSFARSAEGVGRFVPSDRHPLDFSSPMKASPK